MKAPDVVRKQISALLKASDRNVILKSIHPLAGGANNRVYLLNTERDPLVAKYYFRHPGDPRDRLAAEYLFLKYTSSKGMTNIPEPVNRDNEISLAIYSFLPGDQIKAGTINSKMIMEAADFFCRLNHNRHESKLASKLPNASESCFSINQHIDLVDMRVNRLNNIISGTDMHNQVIDFVTILKNKWVKIKNNLYTDTKSEKSKYGVDLANTSRCISPSDFGFHNALRTSDGHINFVDFEYAGWDDPAKMGADFFCQPSVPVEKIHIQSFLERAFRDFKDVESLINRVKLLLPAYHVKWCCIVLNEFLPGSANRRRFSRGSDAFEKQKGLQLNKAELMLNSI